MENGEIGAPPMGQERRNKSGRRRSDRRASDKPTLTNEQSLGGVRHDERGEARWVWASEPPQQDEGTFDELKALDNKALALLESDPSLRRSPPGGGYDPYDVAKPPAKKPARKARR